MEAGDKSGTLGDVLHTRPLGAYRYWCMPYAVCRMPYAVCRVCSCVWCRVMLHWTHAPAYATAVLVAVINSGYRQLLSPYASRGRAAGSCPSCMM